MKRMRGRNNRGGGGGGGGGIRHQSGNVPLNRNHVFDSQGPDLRLRGTAQQLFERYLQLGRDATSGGDRVMAESYFQYAEHYFRILGAMQAAQQSQQSSQGYGPPNGQAAHNGYRRFHGDGSSDGQDGGNTESPDPIEQQLEHQENASAEQPPAVERRDIPIGSSPPES
ncbi:MAG: DUF4167 domain-containing protein [Acetobacteraceae bacterium]|nr:DUF4167 domain-containing protein [Acetobacteraceae bacterium]